MDRRPPDADLASAQVRMLTSAAAVHVAERVIVVEMDPADSADLVEALRQEEGWGGIGISFMAYAVTTAGRDVEFQVRCEEWTRYSAGRATGRLRVELDGYELVGELSWRQGQQLAGQLTDGSEGELVAFGMTVHRFAEDFVRNRDLPNVQAGSDLDAPVVLKVYLCTPERRSESAIRFILGEDASHDEVSRLARVMKEASGRCSMSLVESIKRTKGQAT